MSRLRRLHRSARSRGLRSSQHEAGPTRGSTVQRTSADLTWATLHSGWRWRRSAAPPATWGVAMLVPENWAQVPSRDGTDERIETPGAVTSGFSRSARGVGPLEEKEAITLDLDTAATEMARAAVPGEEIG